MNDELFHIVFKGECLAGFDKPAVQARLAKLFNLSNDKAAAFFTGKPIILKKSVNQDTVNKYQVVLQKAGARVHIKSLTQSASPVQNVANANKERSGQDQDRDAGMNQTPKPSAIDNKVDKTPVELTVAPANSGSFADVVPQKQAPPPPKTDHIELTPPNTDFTDLAKPEAPSPVGDLSHLSLEPMPVKPKKNPFLDD